MQKIGDSTFLLLSQTWKEICKNMLFFIKICFLIFTYNGFIVIFKQVNKYFKILSVLVSNTLNTDRDDLHKLKLSLDLTNLKNVKVISAQKVWEGLVYTNHDLPPETENSGLI